jgi:hypothetical protein
MYADAVDASVAAAVIGGDGHVDELVGLASLTWDLLDAFTVLVVRQTGEKFARDRLACTHNQTAGGFAAQSTRDSVKELRHRDSQQEGGRRHE